MDGPKSMLAINTRVTYTLKSCYSAIYGIKILLLPPENQPNCKLNTAVDLSSCICLHHPADFPPPPPSPPQFLFFTFSREETQTAVDDDASDGLKTHNGVYLQWCSSCLICATIWVVVSPGGGRPAPPARVSTRKTASSKTTVHPSERASEYADLP